MDTGSILLLVVLVLGAVVALSFYDSGKKALSIFPDIRSVHVIYRDKTASGYSTRSWETKFGGASRALDIVVTDKELWLKSFLLLAGITKQNDLLHKIPLEKITGIQEEKENIMLDFKTEKGNLKHVVINTRDKAAFVNSLRPTKHKTR